MGDPPLLTCRDRRRINSSATVFHLDSSLLAAFLRCDTDMGLSSMGLLLLPLCLFVSARPQNRDLVMEDILEGGSQSEDSKVDVDQAFDLKIDAVEGAVNNSNLVQSMALSCPPPVATFLSLDDQPYMNDNEEYVGVARKQVGEVVGTLRLSAASPYFSSPQCSVQEDPEQLYSYFGVREEFNADTFSRGEECQVYLARSGLPVSMVNLTLLVVAEVTPGLPITCDVQVMVKVPMRIYFCTKGEKEKCKVPSSAIADSPEGFENSNNSTTKDNNNNNNNNNNINNNSSADNNSRTTTKTNSKSGSDSDQLKPNNMFGNDKNNVVNSAGAGSGFIEENIEAGKVEGGRGGVEMQEPPGKGGPC